MHVVFNAYFWNQPQTGSGQYLRQLVYYLNRLVSDLQLTLVYPQVRGGQALEQVPPSVKVVGVPAHSGHFGKLWFEQISFPRACQQLAATLAHVPYWASPLRSPVPVVVTVHDMITWLVPEYRRGLSAKLYNSLVAASARGAAHLITDSHSSRDDLVHHLQIPAQQITPIYLGISPQYSSKSNLLLDMAVAKKYNLPDFFVLYLGGYSLHKNVTTLLLAYSYVAQAMGEDYPLLLAGTPPTKISPQFPDYTGYIEKLQLQKNVRWLGFVEEEEKPALYRHATSFVFPSRYEGFGLPPLEAMACGVPVIATTTPCLNEILGDAAIGVEAEDERQMAGAIIATLVQENLAAELKQKGLQQVQKFSWEKTAQETVAVYTKVG